MKSSIQAIYRWHAPLAAIATVFALLTVISTIGIVVDDRMVNGAGTWEKPFKFSISFAMYAIALAWMINRISHPRWQRAAWWFGLLIAVTSLGEVGAIAIQAARGRASHFNSETTLDLQLYIAMGVFVAFIYLGMLAVAVVLARVPLGDRALTMAIRLGIVISVLGLSVGFLMQFAEGHSIGVADGGPGLPILNWSTEGGDLRVGHFIGMHALQVIPLLALGLAALPAGMQLTERARVQLVVVASAFYLGITALTVWQALQAQPFLEPSASVAFAGVALLLLTVYGTVRVVSAGRLDPDSIAGPSADTDSEAPRAEHRVPTSV